MVKQAKGGEYLLDRVYGSLKKVVFKLCNFFLHDFISACILTRREGGK